VDLSMLIKHRLEELGLHLPVKIWRDAEVGRRINMLWTVFLVLLGSWLLGLPRSDTAGGFIHILVFVGVAVVLKKVIEDRRSVAHYWRRKT
jgi:hypothetical protein